MYCRASQIWRPVPTTSAPGQRPTLGEHLRERGPGDVLHRDVRGPLVPPHPQELDDVRVAELPEDLGRALEPSQRLLPLAPRHLDGHRLPGRPVDPAVDDPHGAATEYRLNPERPELLADHGAADHTKLPAIRGSTIGSLKHRVQAIEDAGAPSSEITALIPLSDRR